MPKRPKPVTLRIDVPRGVRSKAYTATCVFRLDEPISDAEIEMMDLALQRSRIDDAGRTRLSNDNHAARRGPAQG